jgi:hypothetical protein
LYALAKRDFLAAVTGCPICASRAERIVLERLPAAAP